MKPTVRWNAFSRTSLALAGGILFTGLAACGGISTQPRGGSSTPLAAPVWPDDVTFTSCDDYATLNVGNYFIQSDYWNRATCPGYPGFDGATGTQCIEINKQTGAFSVTQAAPPCAPHVSSFPSITYGCSYGNCSAKADLPMKVNEVSNLTGTWDFAVGGTRDDSWNVGYELWFCPDNNCGASGFPGGLELMIWLDYQHAAGYKDHHGTTKLGGYTWDVWEADPGNLKAGSETESWTYMDYIIHGQSLTSVTDLDLNAFIKDAVARGYMPDTWYLYSVQGGMEVRSGGMPFNSNNFSLVVNGSTPSTAPLPDAGLACVAEPPTADGQFTVADTYVTVGPLHGYAATWMSFTPPSVATGCVAPVCTGGQLGDVGTCSPALGPSALCIAGAVSADSTYYATMGIGFMLNQDQLVDGSVTSGDGGVIPPIGTITIPNSITINLAKSGTNLYGNNSLRAQLVDVDGHAFCYGGVSDAPIPVGKFNTKCWNNTGDYATPTTAFTKLDVIVPSSASSELDFSYCITNVVVQ